MTHDQIIDEIQTARAKIEDECDGDFTKLREYAEKMAKKSGMRIVNRGPNRILKPTGTTDGK